MSKTIYIHIGAHKTGTSAIQRFLSSNRGRLSANGILYPGKEMAHHAMAEEFRTLSLPQIMNNPKRATHTYVHEMNGSNLDIFILSSETFERFGASAENLKKILIDKYKVKIIYYVRRQDDKIESVYNASVKNPQIRSKQTFSEFISQGPEVSLRDHFEKMQNFEEFGKLDYYSVLSQWSEAFGKENIIVRCYEKDQLPKGIFYDFLNIFGIRPDSTYHIPENKINMSLNWDLIEVIRLCNIRFKDDLHFHRFLLNNLALLNRDYKDGRQRLLSPQKRRDIITLYEESNEKVAREYLGRPDGRLFYAPMPDLNEPWTPYQGLTVEKIVPIFTQMIFNLDRKHQRQRAAIENRLLNRRILIGLKKIGSRLGLIE